MGFFDDLFGQPFGGIFDFNGDGKTDIGEEWVGYMIINDCMKKEKEESSFVPYSHYDSASDSLVDDEDADEDWRSKSSIREEYGLAPYDYDTEEEYQQVMDDYEIETLDKQTGTVMSNVNRVQNQVPSITVPVNISFSIDYPGKAELEAINPKDYPNTRMYKAAYYLCELKLGTAFISSNTTKQKEIEKCEFILSNSCTAAKYLTIYDGFLFAQAIKENFQLPVEVPDEDEEVHTYLDGLFMEIAEEDVNLAVDIWVWLIKEFAPYKQYMKYDRAIFNAIISSVAEYPPQFLNESIKRLGNDTAFVNGVITENTQHPYGIGYFVSTALKGELYKEAQVIFTATALNKATKSKNMESLIENIIFDCSNWEELESMEAFKIFIMPIIKGMNDKRIQRLLPGFIATVDHYISSVEESAEKYQYSRKFEWRNKYIDVADTEIDPLDYKTEEAYKGAIVQKKYAWRKWRYRDAEKHKLNITDYETEREFLNAIKTITDAKKQVVNDSVVNTDNSIYTLCGVKFNWSNRIYHYLAGDNLICVGDFVVVPVGTDGTERIVEVVSITQCKQDSAPFPIANAKTITGIYTGEKNIVLCPLCQKQISADDCYEICCAECTQGIPDLISYEQILANKNTCDKCKYHY